ncbi:unnamed protein product [Arabidopsis thaliana]|uniref:(thale cress) hypothetical protein n=1 Tax=Arabidopsis thaliana TaxID=3702 RepID=A0A7G2EWC2_ARATH|nr:unnamed protein product [Arabidopsis thaliana]
MEMTNWERRSLLNELIHGLKAAKQLQGLPSPSLSASSSCLTTEIKENLLHNIVSSFEKAILMLNGSTPQHNPTIELAPDPLAHPGKVPGSPASITGSPKSEEFFNVRSKEFNLSSKKRKMLPKSYYRCTYRNTQYCWATKQVQRSDGDPTIFEVTYRGTHTCSQGIPLPEKRETKPNHTVAVNYQNNLLDNLRSNLIVRTGGLESDAFSFPVTSPFYTHESINGGTFCYVGSSTPSDFTGLISTNTSTGSSPIFDVNFQFDPTADIDTGFPTFLHNSI